MKMQGLLFGNNQEFQDGKSSPLMEGQDPAKGRGLCVYPHPKPKALAGILGRWIKCGGNDAFPYKYSF